MWCSGAETVCGKKFREILWGRFVEKCCDGALGKSVAGKCCGEMVWRSDVVTVVTECCEELLWTSGMNTSVVANCCKKCCEGVLWRSCEVM